MSKICYSAIIFTSKWDRAPLEGGHRVNLTRTVCYSNLHRRRYNSAVSSASQQNGAYVTMFLQKCRYALKFLNKDYNKRGI